MKELTTEQKAQRYDEALKVTKGLYAKGAPDSLHLERIFPELKESEESGDEKMRKSLAAYFAKFKPDDMWDADFSFGDIVVWFEKQSKKPDTDFSDLRTWKYIVDAVWTEKEGIGQYLDSPFTEEVAKKLQIRFGNIEQILANSAKTCKNEQKPAKWHREDEQNLNACLGYIPDEFLRRWLTDIIHVKYDKSVELPKGEDYGIDGLYAAVDILKKTLGKVDGYQSDDGILTHKCAISAVKELSKQKSSWSEEDEENLNWFEKYFRAATVIVGGKDIPQDKYLWFKNLKERVSSQLKQKWSEEDETVLNNLIYALANDRIGNDRDEYVFWLKSLKDRVQPQPKREWSKEDEKMLNQIISIIEEANEDLIRSENIPIYTNWLKNRVQPQLKWKPSELQIEALESATENCAYSEYQDCLRELIGHLKKLREE